MISNVKRILVPTDFSACSKKAALAAGSVASKFNAGITLLNVIDPPFNFPSNMEGVLDYLKENAEQHLERFKKDLIEASHGQKISVKHQIRIGKPVSQILEAISDLNIDLVITGSGSDVPARKVIFGSVSTDIILHSLVPVISIPEDSENLSFKKMLFATNFRSHDLENLQDLVSLAESYQAEIDIIHVSEENNLETDVKFRGFKDLIKEKKLYDSIKFHHVVHENPFKAISDYVEQNDISFLVLNRYKKSVVGMLLDKNYTKKLSVYSKVPLLVLTGK
jgi:nucleotide-binding universal stress UspA family protein